MFPSALWQDGVLHSRMSPFQSLPTQASAFIRNGDMGTFVNKNGKAVEVTISTLPDGGYELAPATEAALDSEDSLENVYGNIVPVRREITRIYIRLIKGAAGQDEFFWAEDMLKFYPDQSSLPIPIPPQYEPYLALGMPAPSSSNTLPAGWMNQVPTLAGRRWVMLAPWVQPLDDSIDVAPYRYDIFSFGKSSGSGIAERSGRPFTFHRVSPSRFSLDSGDRHTDIDFVLQNEPGIWQVRMHVTGVGVDTILHGTAVPVDAGAWTPSNLLGSWRSQIYGDKCSGPYGALGACKVRHVFSFMENGEATLRYDQAPAASGQWILTGESSPTRMEFVLKSQPDFYVRRGWERIHSDGNTTWVLETYNFSNNWEFLAPIAFNPSTRLIRYSRENP